MISEGLVRLTDALIEDAKLRAWFFELEQLSASLRHAGFGQMAEQMRSDLEDTELAEAVLALSQPGTYHAVLQTVRERCES